MIVTIIDHANSAAARWAAWLVAATLDTRCASRTGRHDLACNPPTSGAVDRLLPVSAGAAQIAAPY